MSAADAADGGARSLEDLTEAAAGGLRWVAYARIAIELLLLAAMVLLARIIPPAAFGIFAILIIVQEVALTMPMEGVGGALVQRRDADREHFQAGLLLTIANGLVLAAVTVLAAVLVAGPLFGHETEVLMIAMTPLFLLGAVFALPMAVLRRRLDFGRISLLEVAQNATRVVATIGLALLGLDAPALVFGGMIGMAVGVVLALFFAPVPLPRWHRRAARELLPYGGPAALATISWTGFRNGDYAIVGAVLGPAQAGLYWRAYQLAVEYQSKVAVTMTQIAFPVLSRSDRIGEMLALRQRMVRLQTVVIFPLLAVLVLTAPALIPWLFGPDWTAAVTPTQILVLGGAATLVINACGSALMAMGRSRALLGYGVAHFVVYAAAVLATAHLGIEAVAVSGSVVHTVFLAVAYELLLRGVVPGPQRVLVADLAPAVCACAGLAALALPALLGLEAAGAPVTALLAGVCLAAAVGYLGALRLLFPASARDLGRAIERIVRIPNFRNRSKTSQLCPRCSLESATAREPMPPNQNSRSVSQSPGAAIAGRRMFVTGGAGTIGSTLVDQLVEAGAAEVVVLDNFVRGRRRNLEWAAANGNLTVVDGDVRDRELVAELCEGIDVVFHQAAIRITQCAEEPRLALEVLVDGTFNVVEAAAAARVRKLVAASSASVYGLASAFPTAEDHHPYANDTLYGAAKVFNEGLLRSYHATHRLDYVGLRYFNVYGPRMDVHGLYTEVLVRWMERIAAGEPPLIFGDGAQTMDFVCVPDIARANVLAAAAPVTDAVFNVASGTETSLRELAEALLRTMGSDLAIEYGPERAVNSVTRRLADTTAAERELGFRAEIGLEEGLARLVEWWRAEREAQAGTYVGAEAA